MRTIGTIDKIMPKLTEHSYTLDKEKIYTAEIKEYKEQRSKDANAYFHVLVNKLARYHDVSDELMKINMNLQYGTVATHDDGSPIGAKYPKKTNPYDFYEYSKWIRSEDNADVYIFYKRTHLLNTSEMAKLIDGVVQECKDVGIEILPPRELERLKGEWKNVRTH